MPDRVTKTYFVSGHLDLTHEEFQTHYVPRLGDAIEQGACFVVGDARGCDTFTQQFLAENCDESRVTLFHMFEEPRFAEDFPRCGGFVSDEQRDAAMTAASDDDIAWVRPGRDKSGTAMNVLRRRRIAGSHRREIRGTESPGTENQGTMIALVIKGTTRLAWVHGGTDISALNDGEEYPSDVVYADDSENRYRFLATHEAYGELPLEADLSTILGTTGVRFERFEGNCFPICVKEV